MEAIVFNDGGRAKAGFKGFAGDCVCRSICIVTGLPYREVYDRLAEGNATQRRGKYAGSNHGKRTASDGINTNRKWFKNYMKELGFEWVPVMEIGSGCKVHLKADELPAGKLVVRVSKHFTAMIDGVIHDNQDCTRGGTRCVYGYYKYNEQK